MNAFEIYCQQSNQYLDIKQHTEKSEKIVLDLLSLRSPKEHDLDFLHKILKHARSCPKPCPTKQLTAEIRSFLLSQLDAPSLSLTVCLIDLIKNDALGDYGQIIDWGCKLWENRPVYMVRKAMELCQRAQDKSPLNPNLVVQITQYITQCQSFSKDIERFQSVEYTEFFHTPETSYDRQSIQKLVQNILSVLSKSTQADLLIPLTEKVQEIYSLCSQDFLDLLFDFCCASDDDTIDLLDKVLLLFQEQPQTHLFFHSLEMNPHTLFTFFLYRCGASYDILIDLLLESNRFLSYFHRYLIYTAKDIQGFTASLIGVDLEECRLIFKNTLRVLEGGGFPYNTKPLVKRLFFLIESLDI
ncbi:hypothetical protein BY458DRAFT_517622 [Sporodiniella umbellata]|nr:hypothetical protein BY458DRAFT_517622 [Sporodiniella umbellata]